MDKTEDTQKNSLPQGKASEGSEGTTPKTEAKTYTNEEIEAIKAEAAQSARIKAGRDAKSFELREQSLTEREKHIKAAEDKLEAAEQEKLKDNPEALDIHKQKKLLKEQRAILERDQAEHEAELTSARETQREIIIWEVATAKNVDAMKLKNLSKKFNIEGKEKLEELAEEIASGKPGPTKEIHVDSGVTSGGKTLPQSAKGKIKAGWGEIHK